MKHCVMCVVVGFFSFVLSLAAQTAGSSPAAPGSPASGSGGAAVANGASAPGGAAPAVTGTGKKNYVPLWLSSTQLGDSKLYQTGGDVGIGTTTPAATLDVNGVVNAATRFNLGGSPFAFGSHANGNIFLGFSGNSTMTGDSNTATGSQVLNSNTTGSFNTASGVQALFSNTTGSDNNATGYWALYSNTAGSRNTADGKWALFSNVGDSAFDGWFNTAVGYQALYWNNDTSGRGYYASSNTAVGTGALNANTTGSSNTAVGAGALQSNTTASSNTATGNIALTYNTTGYNNTANGQLALYLNTMGYNNTATGLAALQFNTLGSFNTAVGTYALNPNTTGTYLTCIGYNCSASDGLTNATAVGANATVGESNALVLGGTGTSAVKVGIGTATPANVFTIAQNAGVAISDGWMLYSSRRWKTNIQTLHGALAKVEQLRGVSYDVKGSGKHEVGVIAEEVGAVVPEVVSWDVNGKDAQGVDYSRLTALLIEAAKEQQREFQQQQAVLRAQAAAISSLKWELRATRQTLEKVKAQVATAHPALVAAK